MKISSEHITKVNDLYKTLDEREAVVGKLLTEAKEKHGDRKVKRGDKEVTEYDLWEEIRHNIKDTFAWDTLKANHPKVFEAQAEYEKALKEVQDYVTAHLGIDYRKVTVRDIINLVVAVVEMKNDVQVSKK